MANFNKKLKGNQNPNWKGGKVEVICKTCGNPFKTYPYVFKLGKGKYCSNKCANKDLFGGKSPWNKGIKYTKISGNKHWNWKGGISTINLLANRRQRQYFKFHFHKEILERDNYTCQICGKKNTYLHIDHIKSWSKFPELRFELDNCRTLCQKCHYELTWNRPMPESMKVWGHNISMWRIE